MKRYLVFAGSNYYPMGGWDDFKGDFDSVNDAMSEAARLCEDWHHIVDVETGQELNWPYTATGAKASS